MQEAFIKKYFQKIFQISLISFDQNYKKQLLKLKSWLNKSIHKHKAILSKNKKPVKKLKSA